MQQGRVQLDSDWNEQVDIETRLRETALRDVIGRTGAPRLGGGFRIARVPSGNTFPDLCISPGRYYVDGILCELDPPVEYAVQSGSSSSVTLVATPAPPLTANDAIEIVDDAAQSHISRIMAVSGRTLTLATPLPSAFTITAQRNPRVRRVITFSNQYSTLPGPIGSGALRPALPMTPGFYFAYLDVWQRHVTATDDPALREPALGGPDTATRTQTFWQVRLVYAGPRAGFFDYQSEPPEWLNAIAPSTGRMNVRTSPTLSSSDPCIVPEGSGYRRLENQLYRVEIHSGGNLSTATFKWSRDNGSVVTEWLGQDPANANRLLVRSTGPDAALGFAAGQWVELTDDTREIPGPAGSAATTGNPPNPAGGSTGVFVRLAAVEANALIIEAPSGPAIRRADFPVNPRIRRWDMAAPPTTVNGNWLALEGGIEIRFEAGTYRTGDHWLIPARTFAAGNPGTVQWPQDANGPVAQPPHGTVHHYGRLAVVDWDGSSFQVPYEHRPVFSAITEQSIAASQVTYNRGSFTDLPTSVNTVQLALDEAFRRAGLRDNAIRITEIRTIHDNQPLTIDTLINVSRLARGIRITCDSDVASAAFDRTIDNTFFLSTPRPNVALIFDMPFPLPGDSQWSTGLFGFQAIEINGTVSVSGRDITWEPTDAGQAWMLDVLFNRLLNLNSSGLIANSDLSRIADQVRVRLVLKGNFIFGTGSQPLYLDGEAFAQPLASRIGLATPAGDGRRGGDFEIWFWVRRGHEVSRLNLEDYPNTSSLPQTLSGRVSLTPANGSPSAGAGLGDVTVNLLSLEGTLLSTIQTSNLESNRGTFRLPLAISGPGTFLVQAISSSVAEVRTIGVPPPKFGSFLVAPPDAQSTSEAPARKRNRKKTQEPES